MGVFVSLYRLCRHVKGYLRHVMMNGWYILRNNGIIVNIGKVVASEEKIFAHCCHVLRDSDFFHSLPIDKTPSGMYTVFKYFFWANALSAICVNLYFFYQSQSYLSSIHWVFSHDLQPRMLHLLPIKCDSRCDNIPYRSLLQGLLSQNYPSMH